MKTIEALEWRYATKKFNSSKKIDHEKINRIKEAFNLTPTSYGLQPIKLVVIKDDKTKKMLLPHSYNQNQVVEASHLLVLCIEDCIDDDFILQNFQLIKSIRNTPDEVLAPYKNFLVEHFRKMSNEDIKIWATNQAYLAMGNMLTTCAIEQIDACPMEGFVPDQYKTILGLDQLKLSPVLVMPIGFRAENDEFSSFRKVRRPIEDTVIELS